jgi:hypothetical protein
VAERAHESDAALTKFHVDRVVDERRQSVADEGREEHERDDGVGKLIVFLEVWNDSAVSCIVLKRSPISWASHQGVEMFIPCP